MRGFRSIPSCHRLASKWIIILLSCGILCCPQIGFGDDEKKKEVEAEKKVLKGKDADEVLRLKWEVDALETLFHFEPTRNQLTGLLPLAERSAAKPKPPAEITITDDYRKTLQDLRAALAKDEEERVDELIGKLSEILGDEKIVVHDEFEITEAAQKAAPAALKLFRAGQVVSFLAVMDDEVPDPVERVMHTLSEGEELTGDAWKSLRDETAEEIAWLVHGFDAKASTITIKDATTLLEQAHRFKGDALKKELPAIERAARKVVGAIGPTVVLQHFMERELAEFLSNPRAVAAIKARLEKKED